MATEYDNSYQMTHGLHLAVADLVRLGISGDVDAVERLARRIAEEPPRGIRETAAFTEAVSLAIDNARTPRRSLTRTFRSEADDGVVRTQLPEPLAQGFRFNGPFAPSLDEIVSERRAVAELARAGLEPASKILVTGEPGVGKTMSAHWLAGHLGLPLVVLDLARSMSSYLGETGRNIQNAFAAARSRQSVFLIDEFDAVAKRRDDSGDLGELKRLVNVLLLELDGWHGESLLIAATNHRQLLDPAIQRRFDLIIDVPLPSQGEIVQMIASSFGQTPPSSSLVDIAAQALLGWSNSDVVRFCRSTFRNSIVTGRSVDDVLVGRLLNNPELTKGQQGVLWAMMEDHGMSLRAIGEAAGVSHPTVSKRVKGVREHHE